MTNEKETELYKKYRPDNLNDVVGNLTVVEMLKGFVEADQVPQFMMFDGPSGCGKTTLARILSDSLGCRGTDYQEINAASDNGIGMVRKIRPVASSKPLCGDSRVFVIDEAHELTKPAQNAALKLLEDTPKQTYIIFCTTEPGKLLRTIKTRATEIKVSGLNNEEMGQLLLRVAGKEDIKLHKAVAKRIVENCGGSPREALVHLNSIRYVARPKDQAAMISGELQGTTSYEMCKLLAKCHTLKWTDLSKALKLFQGDPESCRLAVLGYFKTILLNGSEWAYPVMEEFEEPLYANKFPGLCLQFYRAWLKVNNR
jgi:DNA polymerase III gamma/tau subunit